MIRKNVDYGTSKDVTIVEFGNGTVETISVVYCEKPKVGINFTSCEPKRIGTLTPAKKNEAGTAEMVMTFTKSKSIDCVINQLLIAKKQLKEQNSKLKSQILPSKNKRIQALEKDVTILKMHNDLRIEKEFKPSFELTEASEDVKPEGVLTINCTEGSYDKKHIVSFEKWKWYAYKTVKSYALFNEVGFNFGIDGFCNFCNDMYVSDASKWELADTNIITSLLKAECEKRGIVKGARVKCLYKGEEKTLTGEIALDGKEFYYSVEGDYVWMKESNGSKNAMVYKKGIFAEVITPAEKVEEIHWFKPQLVISKLNGSIFLTTGKNRNLFFSGICVKGGNGTSYAYYSDSLGKEHFTPFKGEIKLTEPITINP